MKNLAHVIAFAVLMSGCADTTRDEIADSEKGSSAMVRIAYKARKAGNIEAAINLYNKAIETNPDDPEGYLGLAMSYIDKNLLDAASEYVKKAQKVGGDPKKIAYIKGKIFIASGNDVEAEKEFLKYETADSMNALGTIYDLREKHSKAQALYKRVIAISPDYIDAYYNMGVSLMLCKRYKEAIFYLENACSFPDANVNNRSNLALAYGLSGDILKAREIYAQDFDGKELEERVAYLEDLVVSLKQ
ncbi:hypothetical protein FACS189472_00600 [Alphaproteobacteria bacterium]|nr:hypothetical protein FACS189472_00600 [Alphaproteobacteria bacterium]